MRVDPGSGRRAVKLRRASSEGRRRRRETLPWRGRPRRHSSCPGETRGRCLLYRRCRLPWPWPPSKVLVSHSNNNPENWSLEQWLCRWYIRFNVIISQNTDYFPEYWLYTPETRNTVSYLYQMRRLKEQRLGTGSDDRWWKLSEHRAIQSFGRV